MEADETVDEQNNVEAKDSTRYLLDEIAQEQVPESSGRI